MRRLLIAAMLAVLSGGVHANERESLEQLRATTLNLIRLLVEEGVLSKDKAEALAREAQRQATGPAAPKPAAGAEAARVVRVPYVPETVKQEIREQIRQEVVAQARAERWGEPGALPAWLGRIGFEGDVRLRFEQNRFQSDNALPAFFNVQGQLVDNTTIDRERWRVRARLGVRGKVSDEIDAGLRLTTGRQSDAVSTSQTLGNTGQKYAVSLDRAWVRYQPLPWVTLWGGRLPNPYLSTDLIWHDDLGFEGAAAVLKPVDADRREFAPFLTVGAFPIQEVDASARDKWLYGVQAGVEWGRSDRLRTRVGVALYDYRNMAGQPNTPFSNLNDYTAPQFRQKGNSLFNIDNDGNPATNLWALASNFRNVALTASVDFAHLDPVHVVLTGEIVQNVGFDGAEIQRRTGLALDERTKAYQARLAVGMPQVVNPGDWQVFLGYRRVERDAVLDAFTTSDFHLGGTNHRGYTVGGSWGIGRNAALTARLMSSRQIDGPPLAIDVLQFDLSTRF